MAKGAAVRLWTSGVVKRAPGDQEGAEWLRWRRVARMALISRKVSSD